MRAAKIVLGLAVALVSLHLSQSASSAGDKKNPAEIPLNRDVNRHKQFLELAKKGDIDVLFIGDSITEGWGNNKVWKENYAPLKAANFGIGGDQTGHVLWRITEGKELEGISPKVAVVMIGTNNTGGHSAEQIAGGITLIVKTIHEKSPKTKVLLLGVFPRDFMPDTKNRKKISEINKIISKLDDGGKTVKYLDIGQKFLTEEGVLTKEVMPDALHLSTKGYEIWAEAINPTLKAMLPKEANVGDKKNPAEVLMNRDVPRHKEFLALAKKGDIDVVFIGDSITQGWNNNKVWKENFAPLKAANFGISGDQTGHVLWRLTEGKELEGITPKVAVVMIGTNNTGKHSAEEIAGGITMIVKTIQEKSPKTKVLLLGVFPRDMMPETKNRKKISEINKIIAKLDDGGKTVKYLDIGQKFLTDEGVLTKDVMPDFLHLSARGYEIWAEAINPTLKEMLK
jgi:lysophospholipase L1-like esterase